MSSFLKLSKSIICSSLFSQSRVGEEFHSSFLTKKSSTCSRRITLFLKLLNMIIFLTFSSTANSPLNFIAMVKIFIASITEISSVIKTASPCNSMGVKFCVGRTKEIVSHFCVIFVFYLFFKYP